MSSSILTATRGRLQLGLLLALLSLSSSASGFPSGELSEETTVQSLPYASGDVLEIRNNAGTVNVRTWEKNEVEVRWRRLSPAQNPGGLRVRFEKQGNKIFLHSSAYPRTEVAMEVKAPATIHLVMRGIESEVTVEGIQGNVDVATLTGRITVTNTKGLTSALSRSGDIVYRIDEQPVTDARLVTATGEIRCQVGDMVQVGVEAFTAMSLNSGQRAMLKSGDCAPAQGKAPRPCLRLVSTDTGRLYVLGREGLALDRSGQGKGRKSRPRPRLQTEAEAPADEARDLSPAPDDGKPSTPSFKVDVDWVRLNLTVLERRSGRRIPGLQAEDFEVYEDGILQQVASLQDIESPFHLLLLLDLSSSVADYEGLLKKAVLGFADQLRPDDKMAVMAFNWHPFLVQKFTSNRKALAKSLRKVHAGGGTGFYEALGAGLNYLSKVKGRKALVIFSDGLDDTLYGMFDESADVTFEKAFQAVQETDALIYTIFLDSTEVFRNWLASGGGELLADSALPEARAQLEAISRHAGTVLYSPSKTEELAPIFAEIAVDLASQYTLAYQSSNPVKDGRWREVTVRIPGHPEWAVRTRKGYNSPR